MKVTKFDLQNNLKKYFGFSKFKGLQEKAIENIINGNDTFVIMPTGGGKSLIYQLPALILEGTAIVVSPLIALMKNQVDQMNACGVNARFLNSTQNKTEGKKVRKDILDGKVDLLYVAPESLTKKKNIDFNNIIELPSFLNVSYHEHNDMTLYLLFGNSVRPQPIIIENVWSEFATYSEDFQKAMIEEAFELQKI